MIYQFAPSPSGPFTFTPTLDGTQYTAIVTWNVFGQRYYVNIYTLQGVRICTVPMIGSPNDVNLNIVKGYFTTELVYRADLQQFEVI